MIGSRCIAFLMLASISHVIPQPDSRSSLYYPLVQTEASAPCDLKSLPPDIQNTLKRDFGTWIIQKPDGLTARARSTWEARKPESCPGMVMGMFDSMKVPSYALLLVPSNPAGAGYKFVVFSRSKDQPSYRMTTVAESSNHGASSDFIRKVSISDFFNEESKKKFRVQATDGILVVHSSEQEYEADLYYWSDGQFRREPVDD